MPEVTEKLMYSGRVVDGGLQTAVQEYRHPAGRSILMVGCVHVAEPDYYTEVRKIVGEAEAFGATVYMEGISFKDNSADDASEDELAAMHASREGLSRQYEDLPALLDLPWIYQGQSALAPYPETWQRSDGRQLDMIRLVGPQNAVGLAPSAGKYEWFRQLKESKGAESLPYIMARGKWVSSFIYQFKQWNWAQRSLSRIIVRVRGSIGRIVRLITRKPAPTGNGWMHPYIWTYRECIAALRALETKGDVVMLWHPGHMLGIGKILARNGFEPQEPRQWLTVCHKIELTPDKKSKQRGNTGENAGADRGFTRGDAE